MVSGIIFDMDGVIFDSEAKGIECWKEVARRYGIQNIENTCYRCLGVNEKAVVQIFKATYGETFDFEFYSEKDGTFSTNLVCKQVSFRYLCSCY